MDKTGTIDWVKIDIGDDDHGHLIKPVRPTQRRHVTAVTRQLFPQSQPVDTAQLVSPQCCLAGGRDTTAAEVPGAPDSVVYIGVDRPKECEQALAHVVRANNLGRRRRCLARSRQLSRVVASDHRRAHGSGDGSGRRGARARNAWLGGRRGGPQPMEVSSVDRRDRRAREAGRRSNNRRADRQRRLLSNPIRRPCARRVGLDCRAEAEHDRTHRSHGGHRCPDCTRRPAAQSGRGRPSERPLPGRLYSR